ncbi:MAG TPA: hypothetical protein VHQ90_16515 [Thermoanaerobaculia bacterium]|nr:hypothetical protein [Thermoanaerobaculia bacterium]
MPARRVGATVRVVEACRGEVRYGLAISPEFRQVMIELVRTERDLQQLAREYKQTGAGDV